MLTIKEYSRGRCAEIHGGQTTDEDWLKLCEELNNNNLDEVYFHYVVVPKKHRIKLFSALKNCTKLKSLLLKGSTFGRNLETDSENIEDLLESCLNIQYLLIRNYSRAEMVGVFEKLGNFILQHPSLNKLSLENLSLDDDSDFIELYEVLLKIDREITLNLCSTITISPLNKSLLDKLTYSKNNLKITGSPTILEKFKLGKIEDFQLAESESEVNNYTKTDLCWDIFSGFITVLGITALALALTVLSAASCGGFVAVLGVTAILAGIGMFCSNHADPAADRLDQDNDLFSAAF